MFFYGICILAFAVLYAIKGGSLAYLTGRVEELRARNIILKTVLGGKALSAFGVFIFVLLASAILKTPAQDGAFAVYSLDFPLTALFTIAWLLAIAPSVGEEHGAIGTSRGGWGPYIDKDFGRSYGLKKALQRGVWMGAIMAIATNFLPFIYFSLLFIPCVFTGQELMYRIKKEEKPSWVLSEPIVGGVLFGIPTAMLLGS